jgi:hypothetical protein
MGFTISLEPGPRPLVRADRQAEWGDDFKDWDDPDSMLVVQDVCDALALSGAQYRVSGLFSNPLPTDVKSDLSMFVSQLLEMVQFLSTPSAPSETFELGEQGIDTAVTFRHAERGSVEVSCMTSRPGLVTPVQTVPWPSLVKMVLGIYEVYRRALSTLFPAAINDSWHARLASECGTLRRFLESGS